MKNYNSRSALWVASCILISIGLAVVGCGGDNGESQFDCQEHIQCLDNEACIGDVCVDAPTSGDECPEEHEGEEYQDLRCHEGQWQEGVGEPPTIVSVSADPESAEPGQSVDLEVEVDWEADGELEYEWSAPGGWEFVDDDAAQVELVAHEEPGQTATVEVVVTDPFGESDEGDVEVSTVAIEAPQITDVIADPPTVDPGASVDLTVEVDSEVEEELEYSWSAPEGWEFVEDDAPQVELGAINEPDVTATIEVEVTDPFGESDEGSVDITTHDPEGPQIESIEVEPREVLPGKEQTVTVEATHPLDHQLEYEWELPGSWEAVGDLDENAIVVRAPSENGLSGDVEVTVSDEFNREISTTTTVRTEELFCGGVGTESDPWEVCSATFVNRVGHYESLLGDYFLLTEDVDMTDLDEEFNVIGDEDEPFEGVFDGDGNTIENLVVDVDGDEVGLFGRIGGDGEVYSLRLEGVDVEGQDEVGALAGRNAGAITDIRVDGQVGGDDGVGGVIGRNLGTLVEVSAEVDVSAGDDDAGGLVGLNIGDVADAAAHGDVEGDDSVGGLVGRNVGAIEDAYATGDVEGDGEVGGLVGDNGSDGSMVRTFSTGAVEALFDDGGLVGRNSAGDGDVQDSMWDVEASGMEDSAGGMGWESTEEFRFARNYPESWEFYPTSEPTWVIREDDAGQWYPSRAWEIPCEESVDGEMSCEQGVCDTGELVCVPCNANATGGGFGGGEGSSDEPWRICTADQLNAIEDDTEDAFELFDDIDMDNLSAAPGNGINDSAGTPPGEYYDLVSGFAGTLEGNQYQIQNLLIERSSIIGVGLFRDIESDGVVRDLIFVNSEVVGRDDVGVLAGVNDGRVEGCHVMSAKVVGVDNVGGLVGFHSYESEIVESSSTGTVGARNEVAGGLVGQSNGNISQSFATGEVVGDGYVGGLVGKVEPEAHLEEVYADADVDIAVDSDTGEIWGRAGGLFGAHEGSVEDCYATSNLDFANGDAGGLAGWASGNSSMKRCYSITGVNLRIFVGSSPGETFERLYWDRDTTDATNSNRGEDLSTAEFGDDSNFITWDFNDVWTIGEAPDGEQRPIFLWQEE